MFLYEPPQSAYDLRFRLLGTDVRVHPLFWLMALLLGWPSGGGPTAMRDLLIWVACVFVSILVHEFGHVLMGRVFGSFGYIVLYSFGGLAVGSNRLRVWWQRVLVSLAGPGAGFLLLAMIVVLLIAKGAAPDLLRIDLGDRELPGLIQRLMAPLAGMEPTAREVVGSLIAINLWWGVLNLLPVWPLDGGHVCREICQRLSRNGLRISLGISMGASILLAVHFLAGMSGKSLIPYLPGGGLFSVLFFAAMAYGSYQELQMTTPPRRWRDPDNDPWSRHDDRRRGG